MAIFNRFARVAALLVSMILPMAAHAGSAADLDQAMSYDGLQKITVAGIDLAYARPGATLTGYNKIQLAPIAVLFHKNWERNVGGSMRLGTKDIEKIRTGVAKLVHDEFVKELQGKGGYQIVSAAGPDVLLVKPNIINLYVNAPDVMTPGRSRTYTVSAGEMTLYAELADSETGEVLARVIDRQAARTDSVMRWSNSVTNTGEARTIAAKWASILRNALDRAHTIGSGAG